MVQARDACATREQTHCRLPASHASDLTSENTSTCLDLHRIPQNGSKDNKPNCHAFRVGVPFLQFAPSPWLSASYFKFLQPPFWLWSSPRVAHFYLPLSYPHVHCTTALGVKMVLSLNYRRPAYVGSSNASVETEKSHIGSVSSSSSCPYGIPEALSFEKIISGGTCPVGHALSTYRNRTDLYAACDNPRVHGFPCLHRT